MLSRNISPANNTRINKTLNSLSLLWYHLGCTKSLKFQLLDSYLRNDVKLVEKLETPPWAPYFPKSNSICSRSVCKCLIGLPWNVIEVCEVCNVATKDHGGWVLGCNLPFHITVPWVVLLRRNFLVTCLSHVLHVEL